MPKTDKQQQAYKFQANAKQSHLDIHLYGVVGGWRVNIQRFQEELQQFRNLKTIAVYISSLGGTFMDGLPIYQTLRQHPATVTTINMGYALSMGSIIMLAGDKRKMGHNCLQMLHSPNLMLWDAYNAVELRKLASTLDKHEQAIIPRYAEVMKRSPLDVKNILDEETWYTADEAMAVGLIHEITDPVNLDEIEEQMTEDHWRETVAMLRKEPPEAFWQRASSRLPNIGAELGIGHKIQLPEPLDEGLASNEDDNMTDEQFAELKQVIADALSSAVKSGADATVNARQQQNQENLNQLGDKIITAMDKLAGSATLEKAVTTLGEVAEKMNATSEQLAVLKDAQPQLTEKLDKTLAILDEVQKLPVNNPSVPAHGNSLTGDSGVPLYS